jgi:hypothetical protein
MQLQTDELIKACANLDPHIRMQVAEALDKLRLTMMEKLVEVDADVIGEYRGGVRVLKQLVHVVAHAPQLIRQLDVRDAKTPKLVL